jgi:Ca2+-binding EF-hand superfamily protein
MPNKEERARIFRRMDYNGNGVLSLAEIDKAVIELWPQLDNKKVLMRAYKAADVNGDGFIGRREFRLLLQYMLYFHRLWDRFDAIDTDHDHRLTLSEFTNGCSSLGIPVSEDEAASAFAQMDRDNGGVVRFIEFCVWCARYVVNEQQPPQERAAARPSPARARGAAASAPAQASAEQETRQRGRYREYRRVTK